MTEKKATHESMFHPHFVTCKEKKKGSQRCSKVFVNWKISSFKKTPSIYIPLNPLPFMPSLLSISKLLLRASGGMITERKGL